MKGVLTMTATVKSYVDHRYTKNIWVDVHIEDEATKENRYIRFDTGFRANLYLSSRKSENEDRTIIVEWYDIEITPRKTHTQKTGYTL